MNSGSSSIQARADEMRRHFDEAFASPPRHVEEATEALLAITTAGEAHALRLRDISALVVSPRILTLPSSIPDFLGVAAHRGDVIPVFSLSRLLGQSGHAEHVRWIVLAGEGSNGVGLGFYRFDGYLQVNAAEVFQSTGQAVRPYMTATARQNGILRGIVDIPLLVERIRKRATDAK